MNIKQKLLSAVLLTAISAVTMAQTENKVEVNVETINGHTVKTVTVNGKHLNDEEITQMEIDGNISTVQSDEVEISVTSDGDKVIKKIIMNGEELSDEDIAALEANGQLKTINLSSDEQMMSKIIFIKNDSDSLGSNSLDKHIKVFAESVKIDDDHATLGFIANIKEDGWHIISVVKGSGAEDSGLQMGDVVKYLGNQPLNTQPDLEETLDLTHYDEGEIIDLTVDRNGSEMHVEVEARKNNSADILMNINAEIEGTVAGSNWATTMSDLTNSDNFSVMIMNSEDENFSLNNDDIHMVFPDKIGQMKMFITQGDSISKLLGKNHKLSALNAGLAEYFNTDNGVLVLQVSQDNVFGLQNGDVIKNINETPVKNPKDVIKALLKADKQHKSKLKVVRHKRNKTLKYNK